MYACRRGRSSPSQVIPLGEIYRWVMTSDPTLHYALGGVRETMSTNGSGGTRMVRRGRRTLYRIVVRSELSERYAVAFEGMEMETKGGVTILAGKIIDRTFRPSMNWRRRRRVPSTRNYGTRIAG